MSNELPISIQTLHQEIRNTLWRAITVIEEDGNKLKLIIDGKLDTSYLTSIRMRVLNQKNQLIDLKDLMREVLTKQKKLSLN
jgi:hypothetical protein